MSLLDKLWDETLAGPRPESGLGKLRKHPTFSLRSSSGKESDGGAVDNSTKVTRQIMMVKPAESASPPVSPAASTPPASPFVGRRDSYRFRRSVSEVYEKANGIGPKAFLLLMTCDSRNSFLVWW
ncbi:hypothetical protein NMG60_11032246 [Bertholletia excelsa]